MEYIIFSNKQGTYLANVLDKEHLEILQCIEYPSQSSHFQAIERKPYDYKEVVKYNSNEIHREEEVNQDLNFISRLDYIKSCAQACREKINTYSLINAEDKLILMRHLLNYRREIEDNAL